MTRFFPHSAIVVSLLTAILPPLSLEGITPAGYENWYPHRLQASKVQRIPGPFETESLAFFLVHHGGDLQVSLVARRPEGDWLMKGERKFRRSLAVQFYDAAEKLKRFAYHNFTREEDREFRETLVFSAAPAGVYQLRYSKAPGDPTLVDVETTPACSLGVMPVRTRFRGVKEAYLFIPPGTQRLDVPRYAADIVLENLDGSRIAEWGREKVDKNVEVAGPRVVKLTIDYKTPIGAFNVEGIPPIFCADADTAENIRASIEVAPDGRLLAHRFQLRMWKWMQALSAKDLAVEPQSLSARKKEWLADPRNAGLLGHSGAFSHLPKILGGQNLDPKSPDYGLDICTSWLGPAYMVRGKMNPYGGNRAILNRLVLQEFAHYLKLEENGTFNKRNWDHYFGGDGLGYRHRSFQFGYVAPAVADSLRELWFEGCSKLLYRSGMTRVSCENQTSHWLLDLWMLGEGSGDDVYKTMAHDFAVALEDPAYNSFMRTGYQQERYGPDATYQGLCASQQAIYYKYSRDETVLDGLRRIYNLFNHTVAPEPDGKVFGASNFSHRTSGSWVQRQYNAGLRLMRDELPEAAVWYANSSLVKEREQALADIGKHLSRKWDDSWYEKNMRWLSSYAYHPWLGFFHRYTFPPRRTLEAKWPVLATETFTKNFNDEFLFVRHPGYYAAVYTGRTSHAWVRGQYDPLPFVKGWEEKEGSWCPTTGDSKKNSWRPTQGLSLFWTPDSGTVLLGKCWNAYTTRIVRADLPDGTIAYSDYWSLKQEFSAENNQLSMSWQLSDLPVQVERGIVFSPDGLQVNLRLKSRGEVKVKGLVEQFPILLKEGLVPVFLEDGLWSEGIPPKAEAVRLQTAEGKGVEIRFPLPVQLRWGIASRNHGQTIRCLELVLEPEFHAGECQEVNYSLSPLVSGLSARE